MIARLWRPPRRLWRAAFSTKEGGIGIPFRFDLAGLTARLMIAWGNSPPNHLADRAGRHRRVAIGLSLLTVPLVAMAGALYLDGGFAMFATAHLGLGACSLWLANDLTRWASLVGRRRRPHVSIAALFLAVGVLRLTYPAQFREQFGSASFYTPTLLVLGVALLVRAADDRRPDPLVGLAGRLILIGGAASVGVTEFARMIRLLPEQPLYSIGLFGAGLLMAGMAGFEGRLLCRGVALARLERSSVGR